MPSTPASVPALPRVAIVGLGAFGRFAQRLLSRHLPVVGLDLLADPAAAASLADCPVVVLAVPFAALAGLAEAIAPHLSPGCIVVDVCSIKQRPMALLRQRLPAHVALVATHPLFGPHSGRDGVAGLKVAFCTPRQRPGTRIAAFLRHCLGLKVFWLTPADHDRQMAHVQGLSHLIARALSAMDLPDLTLGTESYRHLVTMRDLLATDSPELFRTITRDNAEAAAVIARFAAELNRLTATVLDGRGGSGPATC